jgi:hypothetical protein
MIIVCYINKWLQLPNDSAILCIKNVRLINFPNQRRREPIRLIASLQMNNTNGGISMFHTQKTPYNKNEKIAFSLLHIFQSSKIYVLDQQIFKLVI